MESTTNEVKQFLSDEKLAEVDGRIAVAKGITRSLSRNPQEIAAFDVFLDLILLLKNQLLSERLTRVSRFPGTVVDTFPDTEADGIVFCGKCGKRK